MDEDKKKKITIGIAVVCLVLAIAITLGTRGGGRGGGIRKGKRWVKCVNPDCGAEYQMTNKEYAEEMANVDIDPMISTTPALVCQECQEESIYTAIKCSNEECGAVFFRNPDRRDYPDRCPECGVSETEESLEEE